MSNLSNNTNILNEVLEVVKTISPVDQVYNSESSNAQSGKAIAEILKGVNSNLNIENGALEGSIQQPPDGVANGFNFTGKNANASTLFADLKQGIKNGTIVGDSREDVILNKIPANNLNTIISYGAVGAFASSFGGKSAAFGKRSLSEGTTTIAIGHYSHAEGDNSVALGNDSHAEGYQTTSQGTGSHAEGWGTISAEKASHAEGWDTKANGSQSHAEGYATTTIGEESHAEGYKTTAEGVASHAEGGHSFAVGDTSHAEGNDTRAIGEASHAEGKGTIAEGTASHAGGWFTVAGYDSQTVVGKFNDNKTDTLFEVGNGNSIKRGNAFEVLKDGRAKVMSKPKEENDVVRFAELNNINAELDGRVTTVVFDIKDNNTQVEFKSLPNATKIDWGDNSTNMELTHLYVAPGLYKCKIYDLTEINFNQFGPPEYWPKGIQNIVDIYCGNTIKKIKNLYQTNIKHITIPDGVTEIGSDAFAYCYSLTSVTIPDSVTSIGSYAFYWCESLTSVVIPDSVTSIGDYAFQSCSSLTEIQYNATECADFSFPNYIFAYAGQNGEGITVTIGANVKKIPAHIFDPYSSAPKIVNVIFEEGNVCERIGIYAFSGCRSLTSVVIPDSVTEIGSSAFQYCSGLTSVVIPDSVTTIGAYTFNSCTSLTSVVIPDSVTMIGNGAFSSSSLEEIEIPESVTYIGISPFGNEKKLIFKSYSPIVDPSSHTWFSSDSLEQIYVPYGSSELYKDSWKAVFISQSISQEEQDRILNKIVESDREAMMSDVDALKKEVLFNTGSQILDGSLTIQKGTNSSGNLIVQGNLTVNGTTTTENHETINIKNNLIVLNDEKQDNSTELSGLVLNMNSENTYGLVVDPNDLTVKLGKGDVNASGNFEFSENEGLPLAIRDHSESLENESLLMWSDDGNKIVDSSLKKSEVMKKSEFVSMLELFFEENEVTLGGGDATIVLGTLNEIKLL